MLQNIDNAAIIVRVILKYKSCTFRNRRYTGKWRRNSMREGKKEIKIYCNWSVFISHSVSEVFIALYYRYIRIWKYWRKVEKIIADEEKIEE